MGWVIALGVLVGIVVLWFIARGAGYNRLFSPEHLAELAVVGLNTGGAVREELARSLKPQFATEPYLTAERLAVMTSVHRVGGDLVYHFSLSRPGDSLAVAAGGRFLYVIAGGAGMHDHLVAWAHTPIFHAVCRVPADRHAALAPAFENPATREDAARLLRGSDAFFQALLAMPPCASEAELLRRCGLGA
jgi:hypothetical protein